MLSFSEFTDAVETTDLTSLAKARPTRAAAQRKTCAWRETRAAEDARVARGIRARLARRGMTTVCARRGARADVAMS